MKKETKEITKGTQYPKIPTEKIIEAGEQGQPLSVPLMMFANTILEKAEKQAKGEKLHYPSFHNSGWYLSIETSNGIVGLWSCWLETKFFLGYPKRIFFMLSKLPQEIITKVANEYLEENRERWAYARDLIYDDTASMHFLLSFEEDKLITLLQQKRATIPLIQDKALIPDETIMKILGVNRATLLDFVLSDQFAPLGKFCSPRLPEDKGRVWIDRSEFYQSSIYFPVVTVDDRLTKVFYGWSQCRGIFTQYYSTEESRMSKADQTNGDRGVIQSYRDKFMALACEIAHCMGGATAVNINYEFVLVPEQLEALGYGNVTWLKGKAGIRKGWGEELVRAEKSNINGKEMIFLESGNDFVPWATIRHIPCDYTLDTKQLLDFLNF